MVQQSEVKTDFKAIKVTSKAFGPKGMIPRKYTSDGADINPPLDISGVPEEAKSLVVIMEDADAPSGSWLHWLVWNIPLTHHIHEDEVPGDQGLNDFGRNTYAGPCPSSDSHRYFFKIYALDDLVDVPDGSGRKDVEDAMRDHIVAFGELEGLYKGDR